MLLISGGTASAQTADSFQSVIYGTGSLQGRSVSQLPDGGYVVAGEDDTSAYLLRFTAAGDTLWSHLYTGPDGSEGDQVDVTADGGYIIAGRMRDPSGDSYLSLVRTDADGDTVWTRCFCGNPSGSGNTMQRASLGQTGDGGFVLCGSTENSLFLVKTDSAGGLEWSKVLGGTNSEFGYAVCTTVDGGYVAVGETRSIQPVSRNMYVVRTDASGDQPAGFWTRKYGGSGSAIGLSVQQTADDGFIIAGATASSDSALERSPDLFLLRLDGNGDTVWTRTFGGSGFDLANSVRQTPDGGFVVLGTTESFGNGASDIYLLRLDPGGDTVWTRTFGGPGFDTGGDVAVCSDGGLAITGTLFDPSHGFALFLIRTDAEGRLTGLEAGKSGSRPATFTLQQNYPNPFNPSTTIGFSLTVGGFVTLRVFDALGREVAVLVHRILAAGSHNVRFESRGLASGTYFYSLRVTEGSGRGGMLTRSMVILK